MSHKVKRRTIDIYFIKLDIDKYDYQKKKKLKIGFLIETDTI